jgi:hypothetical protein
MMAALLSMAIEAGEHPTRRNSAVVRDVVARLRPLLAKLDRLQDHQPTRSQMAQRFIREALALLREEGDEDE